MRLLYMNDFFSFSCLFYLGCTKVRLFACFEIFKTFFSGKKHSKTNGYASLSAPRYDFISETVTPQEL